MTSFFAYRRVGSGIVDNCGDERDGVRSDGGGVGEDALHEVLVVLHDGGPLHDVLSRRVHLQMKIPGHMNLRMRYARSRRLPYHISASDVSVREEPAVARGHKTEMFLHSSHKKT